VCMHARATESVLWKGQIRSGASSGSRSGLYGSVRESEDGARGSSTQGAAAVRAHRVMIREDGAGECHHKR